MRVFNRKISQVLRTSDTAETIFRHFTVPPMGGYTAGVCREEAHGLGQVDCVNRKLFYCLNCRPILMWIEPTFKDICREAYQG